MHFIISCPKLMFFKYEAPAPRGYILDRVSSLEIIQLYPSNYNQDRLVLKGHVSYLIGVLKRVPNVVVLKMGSDIISVFCESFDELSCTLCTFHGLKALDLRVTLFDDKMRFLVLFLEHSPKLEALTLYFGEADIDAQTENVKFPDFSTISCLKNSVRTIQLNDFGYTMNEIELARILLGCGLVLKKFVLYPSHAVKSKEKSKLVRSFPRSSSYVEVVIR